MAKKFIETLLMELQAQRGALAQAHAVLNNACEVVEVDVKDVQEYGDDRELPLPINFDPCSFTGVDEETRAQLSAYRSSAARLLSDIVKMSKRGLDAFQARDNLVMEQQQRLQTAEARLEHQSESIADLKEKRAALDAKLLTALKDGHDHYDALSEAKRLTDQLKAERKENVTTIIALKDELAKMLEQKQAIDADKGRLSLLAERLENQLREATRLADERGQALVEMERKNLETEELCTAHVKKLESEKKTLSQDLVNAQESSETLRMRCKQQTEVFWVKMLLNLQMKD